MKVLVVIDGVMDHWTIPDDSPPCPKCNRPWDKHCWGIGVKETPHVVRIDVEIDDGGESVCYDLIGDQVEKLLQQLRWKNLLDAFKVDRKRKN
jgi:hypothetical protein